MAFGPDTISNAGGAAQSLFAGFGAQQSADAYRLGADSTRLAAGSTRLAAGSTRIAEKYTRTAADIRARGDEAEGASYDEAAGLARQNADFSALSTRIQQVQADRTITKALGSQRADVASAGFGSGGSAMDLMRDSARQGSLTKSVLGMQGLITEAGYKEQAKSYDILSGAAKWAAPMERQAGEYQVQAQELQAQAQDATADSQMKTAEAQDKQADAKDTEATGDFVGSAFKAATSIATLFL